MFATRVFSRSAQRLRPIRHSIAKFSDDSHDDFKPKRKVLPDLDTDEGIRSLIDEHVKSHPVLLYMKGTPSAPQCGFSMQVVRMLHSAGADFSSINVLEHPEIREGIKQYSDWPTIPQLYIDGEFYGGCDIVSDAFQNGELQKTLSEKGVLSD